MLIKRHLSHEEAEDFHFAQICCILANAFRDANQHPLPFKVEDFMLSRAEKRVREQTPEDMLAIVSAINYSLGGKVINN